MGRGGGRPVFALPSPVVLAALALAGALAAAGCGRRAHKPTPPSPQAAPKKQAFSPGIGLTDIEWALPDAQGRTLWSVRAQHGKREMSSDLAHLQDVQCEVYADGQKSLEATAPRVEADIARKVMTMSGGVTARTLDGKRSFRADDLRLTAKEEKRVVLEASGSVRFEVDGMVGTGERLVTDPHLSQGTIDGQ